MFVNKVVELGLCNCDMCCWCACNCAARKFLPLGRPFALKLAPTPPQRRTNKKLISGDLLHSEMIASKCAIYRYCCIGTLGKLENFQLSSWSVPVGSWNLKKQLGTVTKFQLGGWNGSRLEKFHFVP